MRLLMTATSPFARKVRVTARVLKVELMEVLTHPMDDDPDFLSVAPLGKVPALMTDEGTVHDSDAICAVLGMRPGTRADLERRSLANGVMESAVALVMESRRPENERSPYWIERDAARIERVLQRLQETKPSPDLPWTCGSITLAVALAYLDFRHPNLHWRSHSHLTAFADAFATRPPMVATAFPKE